ncbi:VCBS domain-containing protein [Neopusillimonas aromaticivorans]|uniref:VCBS domain-containing protein n=1 Tax=Neopusillimonas aromaticivorans TaxID=2979868 RepID=UPI002593A8A3|nr:VCBS domain-containing protein [Neopusillimonas aromaticivorans]WJJ93816.1 VCBS domain-containing protein [Neopusillimonas aromaticivorans]
MSKNSKPVADKTPTTEKIAFQTGAAKNEYLASAINEDQAVVTLDVLANDPGSAKLYSVVQGITSSSSQVPVLSSVTLSSGAVVSFDNGVVRYDISSVNHQSLAQGEVAVDAFDYVIRMGNGALSIATATVEIIGLNDAPTLAVLPEAPLVINDTPNPESSRSYDGRLEASDVDNGAVLTFGFADAADVAPQADGTISITTAYGTLRLNPVTGDYTFTVNPEALDKLVASEQVPVEFAVQVHDEHGAVSNTEIIKFLLVGADEQPDVTQPDFGAVTTFVVNHGLDFVNDRKVLQGFDGNDKLKLAGVKQTGDVYVVDTNGDGQADSSALLVQFSKGVSSNGNGNGNNNGGLETVEIVLSGYMGLTQDQIEGSAN